MHSTTTIRVSRRGAREHIGTQHISSIEPCLHPSISRDLVE